MNALYSRIYLKQAARFLFLAVLNITFGYSSFGQTPTLISDAPNYCEGGGVTLSIENAIVGNTYELYSKSNTGDIWVEETSIVATASTTVFPGTWTVNYYQLRSGILIYNEIQITIIQSPVANFTYNQIVCDSLQFTDTSTSAPGYNLVVWEWDFGDGGVSNLQNPSHQYPHTSAPGGMIYDVSLVVFADSNGFICSDTITLPVHVPESPDIFYTFDPDPTCFGDSTFFFGGSGYSIDSWHWNFGDGNFSDIQFPSHLYADAGSYNVLLSIIDTLGCVNDLSQVVSVNPIPEVDFSMDNSSVCYGSQVNFLATGSANIDTWYWDFGDGSFSNDQNPSHYYPTGGTYTVTLTVTDISSCSNSISKQLLVLPGPTADFSFAPIVCNSVAFTDLSIAPTGYNLTSWDWDFDDGSTSDLQNPVHSFATGGAHDVRLIVTADSSGYSCSDTITQVVIGPEPPTVFFIWNPEPTPLGDPTSFFGTSGNTIVSWYWDFGDGNFALTQDAVHTYASKGTFDVTLTVTDDGGCINSVTHQVTIGNLPDLDFHWNNACLDQEVQFYIDSPPTDIGAVVSWQWDFGDGGISSDMEPIHIYINATTYDVSLTIVDTMGITNSLVKTITVNPLPNAVFSISAPVCDGNPVQFYDYSTTPTGYITEWFWDFGDGNTQTVQFPDDPNVTHVYALSGTYNIVLIVMNSDSCVDDVINDIIITPSGVANFSFTDGCFGQLTEFTDLSAPGDGNIISWDWNFGDPASGTLNVSTIQNPSHMFTASGAFDVTLIIGDINGCSDTIIQTVTIGDPPAVEFDYTAACFGMATLFTVDETITDITNVQEFNWAFGDGNTSTLKNPEHTYAAMGTYQVTLAITTLDGCIGSITHDLSINPLPNANFENTSPVCLSDTIYFTDLSTSANGHIVNWIWDFGDNTDTTITFPDNPDVGHLYAIDASYDVTLIVTDTAGCEHTIIKQVQVVASPIADFNHDESCFGIPVQFTDMSTANGGSDISSWEWFFGDQNSGVLNYSTLQNPSHLFTSPGTFNITFIVVSTMGCSDTLEYEMVVDSLPDVDFTISSDSTCFGQGTEFFGASSSEISTWFWEFGDGGFSIEQNPIYMYTAAGIYTVTLTVTEIGSDQCQNSISHQVYISDAPVANFSYENACLGDSTYFTNLSFSQIGFVDSWLWDFGDGTTSTLEDPSHYYIDNQSYQVTLISFDNFGCSDTITQWIQVFAPPVSAFNFNQACEPAGQVYFFSDAVAGEDGSPIQTWEWDFNDGNNSYEINPQNIYAYTDTCYQVNLRVTDANGCANTDTVQVCLFGDLEIEFSSTQECLGQPTVFYTLYSPLADSIDTYSWNFNDGTPIQDTYLDTIAHIFPMPGTYLVELMALDTNGCSAITYSQVIVDSLPAPQFTNTIGNCSLPTEFTDLSFGGGAFISSWYWDFGDITSGGDNFSTLQNPSHLYGPLESTYQVKLIITNFNGCVDSIIQDVYVAPCLTADFELPTGQVCSRYEVCFVDISDVDGTNGLINEWIWDFGDNNTYSYTNFENPICHTYEDPGDYDVQLIIIASTNGINSSDTITKLLTINPTPIAGIDVLANCLSDSTYFFDATDILGEPLTMWHWSFGDPSNPNDTAIIQNPVYLYPTYDTYLTELKVMNQFGCRDSITEPVSIFKPPQAAFSIDETCMSYYTYFTDESISDSSDIVNYLWNFGNTLTIGDTSNIQNPQYIYDTAGFYTINLKITDQNSCIDSISEQVEIYPIPTAGFNIHDTLQQGQIYLKNTSVESSSYYWDFDYDYGVSTTEVNPFHQYEIDGDYQIMLVAYNDYMCPDTTFQQYDLLFTNLFVPNAFVPGNTNPELRVFKPVGINLRTYRIDIYSAWGNRVFYSWALEDGEPAEGWDGTYNGQQMPTGTYIWKITAKFVNGDYWEGSDNGDGNVATSGTVTLIR